MNVRFYCDIPAHFTERDIGHFGLYARTKAPHKPDGAYRSAFEVDVPINLVRRVDAEVPCGPAALESKEYQQ